MQAGPSSPAGADLTPRAFAVWTAAMTFMLAICLAGVLGVFGRVGPVGFAVGFLPMFGLLSGLAWTGRRDRLLVAALATVLVGLWPLYRWLVHADVETAWTYLYLAGLIDAMLLLFTALEFAKRRGWTVDYMKSPVRRWAGPGSMFVYAISRKIGWPTGVWHTGILIAWIGVTLWCLFWPVRRRPSQPNQPQPVTA